MEILATVGARVSPRHGDSRMTYFALLNSDEQRAAIERMSRSGMGDYTIAAATGLSVEMIRRIIGDPATQGRVDP